MNLSELILSNQTADLREYTRKKNEPQNVGNMLFPSVKTMDLDISYIKGAKNSPVTAQVYAPDTTTKLSGRQQASINILEMLLVKDAKRLNEKDLLNLANPRNDFEKKEIIKKIFDDVDNTIKSVYRRINMMRFEVLQTGKLTLDENGVKGEIDYFMPEEHKAALKTTKRWGETGVNPLDDLYTWVDKIVTDQGVTPTRALMDRATLNLILRNETVKKAINGVNFDRMLTRAELNAFLEAQELPTIAVYDEKYIDETGKTLPLMKANTVVLMPEGKLGNTHFGLTAEEVELVGKSGFEHSKQDYITSIIYRDPDPVGRITKSVARAIPSFEACDEVFVATVR